MFTGIIRHLGKITSLQQKEENLEIIFSTSSEIKKLEIGDSIAIDGVCQTVTKTKDKNITVSAIPETLKRTNFSNYQTGSVINLELPLKTGDKLDGHFVLGHVDETGEVLKISSTKKGVTLQISISKNLNRYTPLKGSITINGVSLTISQESTTSLEVSLIPLTLTETNLGRLKKGDKVNLEIDSLARYLEKLNKSQ